MEASPPDASLLAYTIEPAGNIYERQLYPMTRQPTRLAAERARASGHGWPLSA